MGEEASDSPAAAQNICIP